MSTFIFAGHHRNHIKPDSGAIGVGGVKEADVMIRYRQALTVELKALGVKVINDSDDLTLSQLINSSQPGSGSVLSDNHLNASDNPESTGTETFVADNAGKESRALAKELTDATARILGIRNRGVKTESESNRGRLAILHTPAGIAVLPEHCFITNAKDMASFDKNLPALVKEHARIYKRYEDLFV